MINLTVSSRNIYPWNFNLTLDTKNGNSRVISDLNIYHLGGTVNNGELKGFHKRDLKLTVKGKH